MSYIEQQQKHQKHQNEVKNNVYLPTLSDEGA
jgi:hypothetical protein